MNKKSKIFINILLVVIFFTGSAYSQFPLLKSDADSIIKIGTEYIYNLQFKEAEECFKQVQIKYPDNPAGYFLDAMVEWWKLSIFRNTKEYDNKFETKIEKVLNLCNDRLDKNPLDIGALFFKGGALGFRGRFHVIRESWFRAATDGYNAFDILMKCFSVAPNNHDIMLGTGIYNYFADALPKEYPAIKPLMSFAPSGDRKIGLLQLKAAADYARYASIEAKVILLQIYYDFEKNYTEAEKIADELHKRFPNNPSFHRYLGRCYVSNWNLDKFENEWREILKRYIDNLPGYDVSTAREACYYIGTALMNRQNLDLALKYLYKCDEASRKIDKEPTGFMILTNLKIGKINDMQGKREQAKAQYKKVLGWKDYQGSHFEAEQYSKSPYGK